MSRSAYKHDKKLQDRLQAELRRLRKTGSNAFCADCSDADTRFASVTLGVFLCNRCFGLHRALGAHVTRAKVLTLDAWSEHEVSLLAAVGNDRANSYALANLPAGRPKPGPETSDRVLGHFLREKYELKCFASNGPAPWEQTDQENHTVHALPEGSQSSPSGEAPTPQAHQFDLLSDGGQLDTVAACFQNDFLQSQGCNGWDPFATGAPSFDRPAFQGAPSITAVRSVSDPWAPLQAAGGVGQHANPFAAPPSIAQTAGGVGQHDNPFAAPPCDLFAQQQPIFSPLGSSISSNDGWWAAQAKTLSTPLSESKLGPFEVSATTSGAAGGLSKTQLAYSNSSGVAGYPAEFDPFLTG